MKYLIELVERGLIPDSLTRVGIRHLLQQRLRAENAEKPQAQGDHRSPFVNSLPAGPVAVNTDDANEQHYEVPAEFFEKVLGPNLKYSSGLWPEGVVSLEASEEAMLRLTCERAQIEDGMEILDLGCGWGSLSIWIALNYPRCRVTGVSNSKPQAEFIQSRGRQLGLENLVVVTADMNDFEPQGRFDRVVSVEMFEHMRNWPELFRRIASWLNRGGKMLMHVFCHRKFAYPYVSAGPSDWMAEHFFTGGMMPSDDMPYLFQDDLIVEDHWRINGVHYSRTLEAWLTTMDGRRDQIISLFRRVYGNEAGRWYHRWRIFFLACSELFSFNGGNEWWVSHYRLVHDEPTTKVQKYTEPPNTVSFEGQCNV